MSRRLTIAFAITTGIGLLTGRLSATAQTFAGKTITVTTHSGVGGTYDLYARVFGRHFGNHLPGTPAVIVQNQIGAGGIVAANHAGIIAPKDGTFLTLVSMGLPMLQVAGLPGLKFSLKSFEWLGNLSKSNNVTAVWASSKITSLDDARKRDVIFGVTGAGSISAGFPLILNRYLNTRFKVVHGYTSSATLKLAMERGEIDGRGLDTWAGYKTLAPKEIADGQLNILLQVGTERDKELPNVPLLTEVMAGSPDQVAVAKFLTFGMTAGRPFAAPPGTPADIVAVLRAAFNDMVKSPAFLADAQKNGAEISQLSGQEVAAIMAEIYATPPSVVAVVKDSLGIEQAEKK